MEKVNLAEKFALFDDYFNPRVVGELNGQMVKLVKQKGEFIWHKHDQEDELFLVAETCRLPRLSLSLAQSRQKNPNQKGDDADDHEQFDERKRASAGWV